MKRIISVILSLLMIMTMIPTLIITGSAYDKTINNIHWGTGAEDKYIFWDPVDGATKYSVICAAGGGNVSVTSYNCAHALTATGDYVVQITAYDKDDNQITETFESPEKHFEITPLPTPSNIQIDDEKVSWDPVPYTRYYVLAFCRYDDAKPYNPSYNLINSVFVYSGNSYPIDSFTFENGKDYYFAVKAVPSNYDYGHSAYGHSDKFTYVIPELATITNLAWGTGENAKILSWDPVPGATHYVYACGTAGGNAYTNSINCAKGITKSGDYTATVVAYKDTKAISEKASVTTHFEIPQLSAPTNIQLTDGLITWDAVENADKYTVTIFRFNPSNPYRPTHDVIVDSKDSLSNSISFSEIKTFMKYDEEYYIGVRAMDSSYNYGYSQYGTATSFIYYKTFTVTTSVDGGNGAISEGATVNMGSSYTITVTPDATYNLASLQVNGVDVTDSVADGKYTITDIQADTEVVASFSECDHNWGAGVITTPATCGEKGVRTYTCSKCSKIKTEDIPKLDVHTWDSGEITTASTCKSEGIKTFRCTVCSATKTEAVAKSNTHDYGDYSVTTEASCAHNGLETRKCKVCGATNQRTIDPLPHDYIEATCTEPKKCKNCSATEGMPLGHTEVIDEAVSATCTEKGKTEGKHCSICNAVLVAQAENPALGHIPDKGTVTKEATCTTDGLKTYKCTVCGKVLKTEPVKATGHKESVLKAVKATEKKSGLTEGKKCSVCGKVLVAQKMTLAQVSGVKSSAEKTTSLKLKWSKINGAKYYKVEQSTDGKTWKAVKTVDTNSLTVKSLKSGTKYQFRVTALDSSKKISGKTSAAFKTGTLTSAATVTVKSSKSKTAVASWKKVSGASKYVVYKSTDNKKWTKVGDTTKLTYNLTKLKSGKKIYVKVQAINAYGKASAYSAVKNVTVKK